MKTRVSEFVFMAGFCFATGCALAYLAYQVMTWMGAK
jgi:hypothetical protein